MLSGLGTTAEAKLEKLWFTGKLSWGEKKLLLQLLSLYPNYFQRVIACSTWEYCPSFSPTVERRQKDLLHQEGSQRPECSVDAPLSQLFLSLVGIMHQNFTEHSYKKPVFGLFQDIHIFQE